MPQERAAKEGERVGAGCLGLFLLPWFMSTLFGTILSAGASLTSLHMALFSGLALVFTLPIVAILGSVTLTALGRAMGSDEPIQMLHRTGGALALSVIALYIVSVVAALLSSGVGVLSVLAGAAMLAIGGTVLSGAWRSMRNARPKLAKKRKRHARPPKAPWAHPLARTEKLNMYAEALADEFSVVGVMSAMALSIVMLTPIPVVAMGGLLLVWLALVPDSKWFRARVERKHLAMAHEQAKQFRDEQREFLAPDQITQHQKMVDHVARARKALEASGFAFDADKLERALDHHLWLMQLENYYADLDAGSRLTEIDRQIVAAEADLDGTTGRMEEVLRKRLDVLHRRREQIRELADRAVEVTDRRRTLEETFLLVTEAALAGSTTFEDIDEVLLDLQATEQVVLDLHDDEDELEDEIAAAYAGVEEARG